MKESIVLYKGPSVLDGKPIVCIVTLDSTNEKTGDMMQTWILRQHKDPLAVSQSKQDGSVCGDCPRRRSFGGDCYVNLGQAPVSVWSAWDRCGRPRANWSEPSHLEALRKRADKGLRMGAYGDPWAVPFEVWQGVMDAVRPSVTTGYTHQWRRTSDTSEHVAWMRDHCMASCDTPGDADVARIKGWRFFLAIQDVAHLPIRTVECLAERAVPLSCQECGICNGAGNGVNKASVYIVEHGPISQANARRGIRAKGLTVMQ